ncbi:MAG: reverse gyrase [Thermoprotei archaeon]|nr:MAG: reverse gyrase [Thermoprotei archaeon]
MGKLFHTVYANLCPNCGGEIKDERLLYSLPCEVCLPISMEEVASKSSVKIKNTVYKLLKKIGNLKDYREIVEVEEKLKEVDKIFNEVTGSHLWSIQRTWVKRVLLGKSFTALAPTGVGKTVFGIIMSAYIASKGGKCLIIEPTVPLVKQVYERIQPFAEKLGIRVIAFYGALSPSKKKEMASRIQEGDFDVLIVTSKFVSSRFDLIKDKVFSFIFADDVDSIIKSSKNVDRVLMLLGFSEETVRSAMEVVRLKIRLARLYATSRNREEIEDTAKKIAELEQTIERERKQVKGVLVVSTATGRPRGLRVKLFRELLSFDIGSRSETLRNIQDIYVIPENSLEEKVLEIVRLFGKGGIIYVPVDKGIEYAEELANYLVENGVNAAAAHAKAKGALEKFAKGEVDVLVGVATYYGILVRGLDLPEVVRYAVFAGVPRFKFSSMLEEISAIGVLRLLAYLRDAVEEEEKRKVEALLARLRRRLQTSSVAAIMQLQKVLSGEKPAETYLEREFVKALEYTKSLLTRPDVVKRLKESGEVVFIEESGRRYVLIPDIMTYLQASGRTSRLFVRGLTKGASIVVVDYKPLLNGLIRRSKWVAETTWTPLDEIDVKKLIEEIDRDRLQVRLIREGKIRGELKDLSKTALVVVESPTKAKTIANFFGRPSARVYKGLKVYEVSTGSWTLMIASSMGHIFDLPTVPESVLGDRFHFHGVLIEEKNGERFFYPYYATLKRCSKCGFQFVDPRKDACCPHCGGEALDKIAIVNILRDIAREVDLVLIGTDPDTEGEKIAWDLSAVLAPYAKVVKRIEFHEVTRRAIEEAIKNPRDLDIYLVRAQLVRRIEDRWIGYELSPKLWEYFKLKWLSAGRVQTPVLGWIKERTEEHNKSYRRVFAVTFSNGLRLEFTKDELSVEEPEELKHQKAKVEEVDLREVEIPPPPPFTTDSLITEASRQLGFTAPLTMQLAQELFESGLITYHRTDSTRVSAVGQAIAREYLLEAFGEKGEELYQPRTWGKAGAHECIRPTRPLDAERVRELLAEEAIFTPIRITRRHLALYNLIFRRFIASQMKPARVVKQKAKVLFAGAEREIERVIDIKYSGFTEVLPLYPEERLASGEYSVVDLKAYSRYLVPLYTQGDVVRLMKERGIGRPSTYAKIVQTLVERKYVKSMRKGYLIITKLGREVYDYLTENYGKLVSEERTRKLEKLMDLIERGEKDYQSVLRELFDEILTISGRDIVKEHKVGEC